MKKIPISTCLQWKAYVTPKLLRQAPVHRWLVFPHSFAGELVKELVDMWGLNEQDTILDPFVGAGTTLLAAKEAGISATGYDISPFSVFTANVKIASYDLISLKKNWQKIKANVNPTRKKRQSRSYPDLVKKALSPKILNAFENLDETISLYSSNQAEQSFFRLALFKIMPEFSRAKASGGWLKWVINQNTCEEFLSKYSINVELMIKDLIAVKPNKTNNQAYLGDARYLPSTNEKYTAVITSPPYPNRHDYTRIFGVELMYGFLDWEETRAIRYQSIHSHPESKPVRPDYNGYIPPKSLEKTLQDIKTKKNSDNRVIVMLEGYFVDLYCCFKEIEKVCTKDAKIAVVLGNAQYYGEPLYVDEIAANIGEQVGLTCTDIIATRMRGNSAQQMKLYGRHPSRESVILFRKV